MLSTQSGMSPAPKGTSPAQGGMPLTQDRLHALDTVRAFALLLGGYWTPFVLGWPLAACLYLQPTWTYWTGIPTPDQTYTRSSRRSLVSAPRWASG